MYRIGQFSKINKVTVKTLRYYDKTGLLKPAYVNSENGYRYYTTEQLPVLHQIIALRQIGFSIKEIPAILHHSNPTEVFETRKRQLECTIEENRQQLTQITHYLAEMEEGFNMSYQVVIKELPEVIVFSKRTIVPSYDSFFQIVPQVGEEIAKANPHLECAQPPYCFTIYHDGEYKDENIDVEICEAVTARGEDTETIKFKKIERVETAACVYHQGPYSTIGQAYAHLFRWIADNGYSPNDNPRESYIDGIWNKNDEQDWLTELQVPVEKQ